MTRLLATALVLSLCGSLQAAPPQTPEEWAALRQKTAGVVVAKATVRVIIGRPNAPAAGSVEVYDMLMRSR